MVDHWLAANDDDSDQTPGKAKARGARVRADEWTPPDAAIAYLVAIRRGDNHRSARNEAECTNADIHAWKIHPAYQAILDESERIWRDRLRDSSLDVVSDATDGEEIPPERQRTAKWVASHLTEEFKDERNRAPAQTTTNNSAVIYQINLGILDSLDSGQQRVDYPQSAQIAHDSPVIEAENAPVLEGVTT